MIVNHVKGKDMSHVFMNTLYALFQINENEQLVIYIEFQKLPAQNNI